MPISAKVAAVKARTAASLERMDLFIAGLGRSLDRIEAQLVQNNLTQKSETRGSAKRDTMPEQIAGY